MNFEEKDVDLLRRLLPGEGTLCRRCNQKHARAQLLGTSVFKNPKASGFDGFQLPKEQLQPRCMDCAVLYLSEKIIQQERGLDQLLLPTEGDCLFMSWEV